MFSPRVISEPRYCPAAGASVEYGRTKNAAKRTPQRSHALVLGGGTMGVGIIAMFLGGGWKVDVVSRSASTRDGLPAATAKALAGDGQADGYVGAQRPMRRWPKRRWPKIDIVVETVTEDLALKQRLFAEMEKLARPDCALTSNSSSFPISEIGKGLKTQGRMMGLHFFMPAHLIPLVEVVRSVHTDPTEAEQSAQWLEDSESRHAPASASSFFLRLLPACFIPRRCG